MWGLMPPPHPGSDRATPTVRSAQDLRTFVEGRCIWGLAPPPCPHVNAGRLIPNNALACVEMRVFILWGCSPHAPRQHGMLHPKLRLTAQEKSNRKRKRSNAFSSATPVFLFKIASALREAHNGSGPATAGVWGRHQPPHPKISALFSKRNRFCFIKQFPLDFMPARASFGIKRPAFTGGCGGGVSSRKGRHSL